jgi:hypothetical protein
VPRPIPASFAKFIRADARPYEELARAAGFPSRQQIANLVFHRVAPDTPLSIERLHKLAELVGYVGPVFR